MEVDEENQPSPTLEEPPPAVPGNQNLVSAVNSTQLQPSQPIIPPVNPPAVAPPIAPIPALPAPSVIRQLASLPVRPPVPRPPVPQNGDARTSDSDSDDDSGLNNAALGSTVEYEISEESRQIRERQEKAMQELMMKRRASALAVPTNDMAVRARLRRLGEPITLFGEREMERRDRLRMIMAKLDAEGQLEMLMRAHEEEEAAGLAAMEDAEEEMIQYPFYTEGSKALLNARIDIAKYSIRRAAARLQRARRKREDPDEDMDAEMDWALKQAGSLVLDCSEIGDDRPLSGCSFSRDGTLLATWYVLACYQD